jgi:hypothetical protein
MTLGLARVLDLAPVDRVLGDPIRVLLTPTPLPAREWDRLEALTEEEVDLRDEDPEASRRYRAGAMWQALGWAWWVLGILVVSVFFLAGNSPMRPGFAANVVYPIVTLVTATFIANCAVCVRIGRGRVAFGRPGGGNIAWLLVVASCWAVLLWIGFIA